MELLSRAIIVDPFRTFSIGNNIEVGVFKHLFDDPYIEDDTDELLINPNAVNSENVAAPVPLCLTYVSRGLADAAEMEEELVLTIKSDRTTKEPEAVAQAVEKLFKQIVTNIEEEPESIKQGLIFDVVDGFVSPTFKAVMFGPFEQAAFTNLSPEWIEKKGSYLSILPITTHEATMARYCTGTRVFTLMSRQQNRFPAATIFDPSRESCVSEAQSAAAPSTLLGRSDQGTLSCSAVLDPTQKKITMNIAFEMSEHLSEAFEQIPLEEPMFIQLNVDSQAQGHFVWDSSSRTPGRICRAGINAAEATSIGGSFLGFVPKQSADTVLVHEDGFLAMLKTDHWKLLRHCLSSGMTCGIRSDNADGLEIKFQFEAAPGEEPAGDHVGHDHDNIDSES